MNQDEAIKKAKNLLLESERLAGVSAGPCSSCKWMYDPDPSAHFFGVRLYARRCYHPIVSPVELDVELGEMVRHSITDTREARLEHGLCGIEGKLYEPRAPWQYGYFWVVAIPALTILAMVGIVMMS